MNTQSKDTESTFAWNSLTLPVTGSYSTAVALAKNQRLFATSWLMDPQTDKGSGSLLEWSPNEKKWKDLGVEFTNEINQICLDQNLGIIYMIGTGTAGNYVVQAYNIAQGKVVNLNGTFASPIQSICLNSNGNVYATADNNEIKEYTTSAGMWGTITGLSAAPVSICCDSKNNLYAVTSDGNLYVNSPAGWDQIGAGNTDSGTDSVTADSQGNIYFNSSSTVWLYNVAMKVTQSLKFSMPTNITGTTVATLLCVDSQVYYGGYGYTAQSTTQCFLGMYDGSNWTNLLPPTLDTDSSIIFGLAGYDGKHDNIFVANNSNAVLEGSKLIK